MKPLYFLFLTLLLLWCNRFTYGQAIDSTNISQDSIDAYAMRAPVAVSKSVETLSPYLTQPYTSDEHKVRSLYAWVVGNLSYDYKLAKKEKRGLVTNHYTLRTRKAVCSGYAELFKALCLQVNIKSEVVSGYTRKYNKESKRPFSWSEHAWNAVFIKGEWKLLDPTWELKNVQKERKAKDGKLLVKGKVEVGNQFYLLPPQTFVQDHLPEIPAWQLLPCPLTLEDFKKDLDFIKVKLSRPDTCFNFIDSLSTLAELNQQYRDYKTALMAYNFNPANHTTLGYTLMQYGTHLSSLAAKNKQLTWHQKSLQEKEVLTYYRQAIPHLRKSKRKDVLRKARKNIKIVKKKAAYYQKRARTNSKPS